MSATRTGGYKMRQYPQNTIGIRAYGSLHEAPGLRRVTPSPAQKALQEQKRDARDRLLMAQYLAEGDDKKMSALAKANPRLTRCEICGEWFFKKSEDDDNICLVCQESVQLESIGSSSLRNGTCKWCGVAFLQKSRNQIDLYCGPDCRRMANRLKCREVVRAAQAS